MKMINGEGWNICNNKDTFLKRKRTALIMNYILNVFSLNQLEKWKYLQVFRLGITDFSQGP